MPTHIKQWIINNVNNHVGIVNIEMIGEKIIECHLRMGDINYFQSEELINQVIRCYMNKTVILPKLPKIYLIPVFVKKGEYHRVSKNDLFEIVRKLDPNMTVTYYQIDP